MIELTPLAAEKLNELRQGAAAEQVLRVFVRGKGCCGYSYGLAFDDSSGEEDAVVERAGIRVAVDAQSLPILEGSTIDYVDALMGGGFTVKNPRESGGGCACGRR